jgi:protein-disulfide isomerase
LDVKAAPLDVSSSADGKRLFILTPGEILVYSVQEDAITARIPVDREFDRIASLPAPDRLTISSSAKNTLQLILLETVHKIDVTGLPFKGLEDAPVTVAVFSDYQCPYCAGLEPLLQQVLEKYPKDVKLVLKHFPLQMHGFARKASTAALASARQGKFWEMHEKLFVNQKQLNDAKVEAIGQELGLDMLKFNTDLKDPAIVSLIDRDMQNGSQAEVRGTPTVFINGKPLNQRSLPGFVEAIEAELKKKK